MMKYDFDTPVIRYGTDSIKWKVEEGELPMWVADMDFRTAPQIIEAIKKRADHGVFGYSDVEDEWYDAYINWWESRHGLTMDRSWLMFVTGVIPAISSAVRRLTVPGEKVLIQTPVYNVFANIVVHNGRTLTESPLVYENGGYHMDLADLEAKAADPEVKAMILCNPHNPVGKIWDRQTLAEVGRICHENGVTVISDEIHCDITSPGFSYVPFASASDICRDNSICVMAPTKCFNLAGLHSACISVADKTLRAKIRKGIFTDDCSEPNSFSCTAAITAFNECGDWLDEMNAYVEQNRRRVSEFLAAELPQLYLVPGNATYLLWIDISGTGCKSLELARHIRKTTGLFITEGVHYGSCGDDFLRMNIACPASVLEDGLMRLKKGILSLN